MTSESGDCHNSVHLSIQEQDFDLRLRMLEQTMCGICWCPLVNSETCPAQVQTMFPIPPDSPVLVNCGHVFHPDCLNSRSQFYVNANFHCPLCGELIMDSRSIHLLDGDTNQSHNISSRCSSGYNSPSSYSESIAPPSHRPHQHKHSLQRQKLTKGSPILDRRNIERQVYQSYNLDRRSVDRNTQHSSDRSSLERSIRQCSVRRSVERNTCQSPSIPVRNDSYQSPIIHRRSIDNSYQSPILERRRFVGSIEPSPVLQRHALDRNFQFPSLERRKPELRMMPSPSPTPSLPTKPSSLDRRKLESNRQSLQHFSSLKNKNIAGKSWSHSPAIESETPNKVLYNSGQNSNGMINKVIGSLDKLKIDLITKG